MQTSYNKEKMELKEEIPVVYEDLCPVCGKSLDSKEILTKICLTKNQPLIYTHNQDLKEFETFFEEKTGKKLRSLQRYWASKLFKGMSFSIESPTGSGKTLFGVSTAAFLSLKGKKSYIIVPTTSLLSQIEMWINNFFPEVSYIKYHGELSKKEKNNALERIKSEDFNILLTTAAFLSRNFEYIKATKFDFIFVDDLDAVLKASRNVDKILMLLGFKEEEIRKKSPLENSTKRGNLIISTATTKPGRASLLFRSLLGFDVSQSYYTVRNVDDYAVIEENKETLFERTLYYINILGDGGIIYVRDENKAKELYGFLKEKDINVGASVSGWKEDIELFLNGEIDVIIGISNSYGKLVRGIDAPQRIKYVIFVEVPGVKIRFEDIDSLSDRMITMLTSVLREHPKIKTDYYKLINNPGESKKILKDIFKEKELHYASKGVVVKEDSIFFPDMKVYIQGTGRTSRMYASGVTKGCSVVIDSQEYIDALKYRAYFYDIELQEASLEKISKTKEEIERTRKEMTSNVDKESKEIIKPYLFVVESPTKAKQISRFYGKPAVNIQDGMIFYEIFTGKNFLVITASLGHIVDLISQGYIYGVEVDKGERKVIPHYSSIKKCRDCGIQYVDVKPNNCECKDIFDSKKIINKIQEMAKDMYGVIIATDPDSEGEKIAWDISNFSGIYASTFRAEFHEVTKRAIDEALENLRHINTNLTKAQIVRRIEDRWIGYALTEILRKKYKEMNLSAGRVQTPVLGWIIERYNKNKEKIKRYFININNHIIELGDEIHDLDDFINKEVEVKIILKEVKETTRTPLPPYTTNEILRDASRILKLSAGETMSILQNLFENGLITYHRTDSTRVSDKGLSIAKMYLGDDANLRAWSTDEEGAHECIRPTRPISRDDLIAMIKENVIKTTTPLTFRHYALYDLIFRRFMASQLPPYSEKIGKFVFEINGYALEKDIVLEYKGKAYEYYPYVGLPLPLEEGTFKGKITVRKISKYPLYTEGDIIALMKERGIGRPSTYATILQKLYKRGYIINKNNRLIPTQKGIMVYKFLKDSYRDYVSEETTRRIEQIMDEIENGNLDYTNVLLEFYKEIEEIKRNDQ